MTATESPPYRIEPLSARHDRAAFSSGVEPLDRYLKAQAGQDSRRKVASCFILTRADDMQRPKWEAHFLRWDVQRRFWDVHFPRWDVQRRFWDVQRAKWDAHFSRWDVRNRR